MRADRLMSALLQLQAHGQLTGRELAKRLEVSERTVHRDMEALSSAGVPVFATRGAQGGWQLDEEWRTQVPGLDEAELRALLMAQPRALGDVRLAAAAERALGKLMAALPVSLREQAASMRERLYVDTTAWRGTAENLSMLPIVQESVSRDRKLTFQYWRSGERVERTVDPLGLVAKGSTWYLYANTPRGYRTYRISRMEEARLLDEPSIRPPNFNLAAQWKISTEEFAEEVKRDVEAQERARAEKREAERRAAQELEIAKQVQARLFPQSLPACQTLDYAGVCIQARQVGGDYYDFLSLGRNKLGLILADIAGKGIAAALLMANLQANVRSQCAIASDEPEQMLHSANELFYRNTIDSAYATLFFAEYDDTTRKLRYANCGHLSALLISTGNTITRLDSTCSVLGLFETWNCTISERHLSPGDILAIYSDGVTEAFSPAGEEFGEHRLMEALERHRGMSAAHIVASIVNDLQCFSAYQQHDDITLIVARCHGQMHLLF